MDKKRYYLTTPIYYPNGKFHIGTAYTTIFVGICTILTADSVLFTC